MCRFNQMNGLMNFLKLVRLQNLVIVAFTQIMVRVCLTVNPGFVESLKDYKLWIIVSSTVLIAAAGYIINDYYDVKIDAVNRPERVLLGREMKRRPLMLIHFLLNMLGISLAVFLEDWLMLLLFFISANVLWLYSNRLKRLPLVGNVAIAGLSALAVALPGIYYPSSYFLMLLYVLLAFFISLMRELIKDMEDIRGDQQFGCQTFPIVYGVRKTKILLFAIMALFLGLVIFTWTYTKEQGWYLVWVIVPFSIILSGLIYFADKKIDYKRLSLLCKLNMVMGVLSMLLI